MMAARAMWKGIIRFTEERVPVKLYAAVEDRSVHFRLLHADDHAPLRQILVNPHTDEVVAYQQTYRGYQAEEGHWVMLHPEELSALQPEPSRDINVLHFLPLKAIDHRWYARPYYLGPDGGEESYFALAAALEAEGKEALVRWVMRKKEYLGALRAHRGYLMLVMLRYAEEVVAIDTLEPPRGAKLDARELSMARQLIGMLEAPFEPEAYQDEYRERVLELIEAKKRGQSVQRRSVRSKPAAQDLTRALEASLKREHENA